jgi:hypothetical protein
MRCARPVQLRALERVESDAYVEHRLRVAGCRGSSIPFTASALRALHRAARGTPRTLHVVAEGALQLGHEAGRTRIGAGLVNAAAGIGRASRPDRDEDDFAESALRHGWSFDGLSRWLPSVSLPDPRRLSQLDRRALAAGAAALLLGGFVWYAGWPAIDLGPGASERARVARTADPPAIALSASAQRAEPRLLASRLERQPAELNAAEALARIVELWGFAGEVPGRVDPSDMSGALRAVAPLRLEPPRRTTLDALRVDDRPVILEIAPEPGKIRYAALARLDADGAALLLTTGRRFVVRPELLQELWTGRALLTSAEQAGARVPRLERR